jgi:hypothetical protein
MKSILLGVVLVLCACGNVEAPLADGPPLPDAVAGVDGTILPDAAPTCDDGSRNGGELGVDCGGPCPACVECGMATECNSGLCVDHVCTNTAMAPCVDVAPAHATSHQLAVEIEYIDGVGWTEPAACAWTCDLGYCESGSACAANDDNIAYTSTGGSRWFGGDDRDLDGDGQPDIRSVGDGMSFTLTQNLAVAAVGLNITGAFRSAATGVAHAATVAVRLRNASTGHIHAGASLVVPETFTGGWVTWETAATLSPGTYVLTAYLPNVFSGENYSSGVATDFTAGFTGGAAYYKELEAPGSMEAWAGWGVDQSADLAFRISAACPL